MELNEALGLVIKELRLQRELPQEGLGPSQSYISAIERGKWKPSLEKIEHNLMSGEKLRRIGC